MARYQIITYNDDTGADEGRESSRFLIGYFPLRHRPAEEVAA